MPDHDKDLFGESRGVISMYGNLFSFMNRPLTRDLSSAADVAVMGIPYDLGTSGRSGARFGPNGIRQASANLGWEEKRWPWDFAVFEHLRVIDYGDLSISIGESEATVATIEENASAILNSGKKLLSFGGDHFVALPLLRAHAKTHGPISLIHFDAHTDTEAGEDKYYHGNMFHLAPQEGIVNPSTSVQIGIRTEYDPNNHLFQVLDAGWANDCPAAEIVDTIKTRVGDSPAYITFDIDCLDPAFAPGTGTPVVGGLSSDKALKIMRGLRGCNLVGMDIVEVAPAYDHADITSLAGATLALEFLCLLAAEKMK